MNILTLMGSSALEEVADALTAYLVTEFGKGVINPDHSQEVRLTNPFRVDSDAERHLIDDLLRSVRGISAAFPGDVQASGRYIVIPGLDLSAAAPHVSAGLGGFRERVSFRPSAYIPIAHVLEDRAIGSAVDFVKRARVFSPLFFRSVTLRPLKRDDEAMAA